MMDWPCFWCLKKLGHLTVPLEWTNDNLFAVLKHVAEEKGLKNGQIMYPVRIALSGKETTPGGATELAVILGKTETLKRLHQAQQKLS